MSAIDEVRKIIQDLLAPELRTIAAEQKAIREMMKMNFDALNLRFDDLIERLALAKRIETLEREREERKAS